MPQYLFSTCLPGRLQTIRMDEALKWGRKAAVACRAPVEVRAFL
jgi:hypothetical protein